MLKFNRWQVGGVIVLILLGLYFSAPNFFPAGTSVPGFRQSGVTLGLDLRGGSFLKLEVNTEQVIESRLNSIETEAERALRRGGDGRIAFSTIIRDGTTLTVPIVEAGAMDEALSRLRDIRSSLGGGVAGLGGQGNNVNVSRGEGQTIVIEMTDVAIEFYTNEAVRDSVEVIRRRIDSMGTTEPILQREPPNRIVVQVPGESNSEALKRVIEQTGQLTFHMVDEEADPLAPPPPRRIRRYYPEFGTELTLVERPEVDGSNVESASMSPNSDGAGFQINFAFDSSGARAFRDVTAPENIGRSFAIVLDDEIISAPRIRSQILGGSGRITGSFTPQEASELALLIRSGALPAELTTIEQRTVGADLGADAVRAGTIALILGFVLVVIFIVVVYGRFGIYADIALIANVVLIAGALSMLGATLTLPGIAGIVLTIGMAVDANVLIFERIREEVAAGKSSVMALEAGYKNAWSAIFDANLTTLIAAIIMFQLGSGPVRGFAVTLGIGVITSVFTAFVVTRMLAGNYVLSKRPKTLAI